MMQPGRSGRDQEESDDDSGKQGCRTRSRYAERGLSNCRACDVHAIRSERSRFLTCLLRGDAMSLHADSDFEEPEANLL
jgi:hypothetical protein